MLPKPGLKTDKLTDTKYFRGISWDWIGNNGNSKRRKKHLQPEYTWLDHKLLIKYQQHQQTANIYSKKDFNIKLI